MFTPVSRTISLFPNPLALYADTRPLLSAHPIQIVPTGLCSLPPLGPAMPVIDRPYVVPVAFTAPSAIAIAVSSLTAPYFSMVERETFSRFSFKALE